MTATTQPQLSEADLAQLKKYQEIVALGRTNREFVQVANEVQDLAAAVGALKKVLGTGLKSGCFCPADSEAIATLIAKCRARAHEIVEAKL